MRPRARRGCWAVSCWMALGGVARAEEPRFDDLHVERARAAGLGTRAEAAELPSGEPVVVVTITNRRKRSLHLRYDDP